MNAGSRARAGLVLLLHLLVVGLAPLADAWLEAEARRSDYAHVEPEGSTHCAPGHDHLFCQVCRVVQARADEPGNALPFLFLRERSGAGAPAFQDLLSRPVRLSALGSRAPPAL